MTTKWKRFAYTVTKVCSTVGEENLYAVLWPVQNDMFVSAILLQDNSIWRLLSSNAVYGADAVIVESGECLCFPLTLFLDPTGTDCMPSYVSLNEVHSSA